MDNSNSDRDRLGADLRSAIAACLANGNAILLLPTETSLPLGWAAPWWQSGWKTADCTQLDELSPTLNPGQEQVLRVASGERMLADDVASSEAAIVTEIPVVERRHGRLRRSDFLAELGLELQAPATGWPILIAVRVDQASSLTTRLGQAAAFALEQRIAERFAAVLEVDDAYTLWLEFGFGVLVHREQREQIVALAERICASVAEATFEVADEPCALTVSLGLALPPKNAGADGADRWFASAHAVQAIAQRQGGNRYDGILSHEFADIPAERVLIIREWVREAVTGQNIQIEFQPMPPLKSDTEGLYMVLAKLRDFRAPLGGVYRHEFLRLARDAGAMTMIDRVSLFEAFGALGQMLARGRGTRMLVPVELATLDGAAWIWLEAELHRHRHLANRLIVQLEASPILVEPGNQALLARVREAGAAVALADRTGGLAEIAAWSRIPADFLRLSSSAVASVSPQAFMEQMTPWWEGGRRLIVDGVDDFSSVPRLAALGIDYLQGQALAGSGPRPDYEFTQSA